MDTDPALFVIDLQDAKTNFFLSKFFANYYLKEHLHHSSQIKSHKTVEIKDPDPGGPKT
jgi:hypothetical protein